MYDVYDVWCRAHNDVDDVDDGGILVRWGRSALALCGVQRIAVYLLSWAVVVLSAIATCVGEDA